MKISFITGLIDGDGSIGAYRYKNKKDIVPIITFCGTEAVVKWVCNILNKSFPLGTKYRNMEYRQITLNNTFFLNFSGRRVIMFCKYIINNDIPYMLCKWEKMIKILSAKGLDYYLKDKRKLSERGKDGRFCKIN